MPDLITFQDALQDNAEDVVKTKREVLADYIDTVVMKEPRGPQRWRAVKRMAIELNFSGTPGMSASEENRLIEKDCSDSRMLNHVENNGYHKSHDNNSDLRGALSMPFYVNAFIKLVDPDAFSKENVTKLLRTFPEYRLSDKA